MTIGSMNLSQIWLRMSKYQQQINLLIVILLALYLLAYAAQLTWRLIPVGEKDSVTTAGTLGSTTSQASAGQKVNLAKLKRLNLFGDLTAKPQETVKQDITDAPQTRLNLTLTGVVATNDPAIAAAIIENRGVQNTYGIDDEIEGTNATLQQVFVDRVIIENGARNETLMLDGVDYTQHSAVKSSPQPLAANALPQADSESEEYKMLSDDVARSTRALQQGQANFSDYISVSPYTVEGEIVGYRIAPGKNPILFKEAGVQAGDIVTEINGLDLTDLEQVGEALSELRTAQALQLTITRDEQLLTLYLDFPQGNDDQDI